MIRSLIPAAAIVLAAALSCAAQSPDSVPPSQSDSAKPAANMDASAQDSSQVRRKPKKVWTNDEVSHINGNISVVGDSLPSTSSSSSPSSNPGKDSKDKDSAAASREKQLATYRDQLRQLRTQLEITEKKLSDARNFKGDNSSPSGGVNMNQSYSMTPVQDQLKQLEAKRAQLQDQIDSIESDARKNGFDPGELR